MTDAGDAHRAGRAETAMRIASALLLAIGIAALAYPVVCNALARTCQAKAAAAYREATGGFSKEDLEAARESAERHNDGLVSGAGECAGESQGEPDPEAYETLLDPAGTGTMAVLSIEKIGLELPVYHGTGEEALKKGVGHLESTALPIGGKGCRPVLAGHRGLPEAELFTRLNELEEGDVFSIEVLGTSLSYRICEIEVVSPEEAERIEAEPRRDLATLVTCTPYGANTHRLLVTGERTAGRTARTHAPAARGCGISLWPAAAAGLPLAAAMAFIERRRRHGKTLHGSRTPYGAEEKGRRLARRRDIRAPFCRAGRRARLRAKRFGYCGADARRQSDANHGGRGRHGE